MKKIISIIVAFVMLTTACFAAQYSTNENVSGKSRSTTAFSLPIMPKIFSVMNSSSSEPVSLTQKTSYIQCGASAVNLRQGPSTSYEILDIIPVGSIVAIDSIANGWGRATYNDKTGYVCMADCERDYFIPFYDNHKSVDTNDNNFFNVMDISQYQGDVDFAGLFSDGIYGVILRLGETGYETKNIYPDENFVKNYRNAKKAGLHVGCYYYTCADSLTVADNELEFIYSTLEKNNCSLDLPLFIDMENAVIRKQGREYIRYVTKYFTDSFDRNGYIPGVYSFYSWATDYYDDDLLTDCAVWIADYTYNRDYPGRYDMIQYTSKGGSKHIYGDVDMNILYTQFATKSENTSETATEIQPNPGDVNLDGKINAVDARIALRCSAKLTFLSGIRFMNADVDNDGRISVTDARKILRVGAKLDRF